MRSDEPIPEGPLPEKPPWWPSPIPEGPLPLPEIGADGSNTATRTPKSQRRKASASANKKAKLARFS